MDLALRRRMPTVTRHVAARPEAVWRVLVDLDAWPQWGPSVQRAELTEPGALKLGSRGRVWTPFGVALPFTITEFEENRCWAWQVAGVPATHHGVEATDGGCRAWMSAPLWAPAYLPVLAIALQRIDRMTRAEV
ncbi:SRPBCC family protein [Mycobacterium sp. NPDC051804]|uniref:SRPBCC family protein n=1 Tax=Mycobacterium sp. NPDC051804 TaxID=3364295 RepID=UPI00379A4D7B